MAALDISNLISILAAQSGGGLNKDDPMGVSFVNVTKNNLTSIAPNTLKIGAIVHIIMSFNTTIGNDQFTYKINSTTLGTGHFGGSGTYAGGVVGSFTFDGANLICIQPWTDNFSSAGCIAGTTVLIDPTQIVTIGLAPDPNFSQSYNGVLFFNP